MKNLKSTIKNLLMLFNRREKKKLIILFIMIALAAVFETVGIGLIVPFVGIITNPSVIQENEILAYVFHSLQFKSDHSFMVFSVIILLIIFVLKNFYLLFFQYAQFRVILNQQVKLSQRLLKEYLTKSYTFHLQRNSSSLLRNVNEEVSKVFQGIILSSFQLFTEILVIICILSLLLLTAFKVTIIASILLGGSVFLFFKVFRKKITVLGKEQQKVNGAVIKWVNQGLGASKEVKVSGKEDFFVESYRKYSQIKANNSRYMKMLEQVPRLFIETLLVSIILVSMLLIIFQGTDTTQLVSTMALFAMAAFRLMPSITRVVALVTTIRYSQPALTVICEDLLGEQNELSKATTILPTFNNEEKYYKNSIELRGVSFRYPEQKELSVKNVSLSIPIGQSVAFIGESGAGKTTIVDIILGLFEPEKGEIWIDGKPLSQQKEIWQQKIGYIPQSIFLSDDNIRGNVAFGVDPHLIDDVEVWRALEQAQLKDFIQSLPNGLETTVGERGVKLSGGQRQRIGIARALYHNPEILFMDEATSALDNETEKEIMKAIDGLKGEKTLIIIAHRLSTIANCDIIFKIARGELESIQNKLERSVI
ncbi:ABC transporter ATP-binding protein [Bacillus niameyensis]|uniref:ABC transporter ATP-binding protein n=1 Tax=Bacillus niameyensis TaxID=1522308 RepID=UPI001E61774C|nr:ABC transporter ATP-binding protein [Bacillus niameyensis]